MCHNSANESGVYVPPYLKSRLLSVVDSSYMRNALSESCLTIYEWIQLITEAPKPMNLKLDLLREFRSVEGALQETWYADFSDLDHAISLAETVMDRIYNVDPQKSLIQVRIYNSNALDPYLTKKYPCCSYDEALENIRNKHCGEDTECSIVDESNLQGSYILLDLYDVVDGNYELYARYYCTPDGIIQFFRMMDNESDSKKDFDNETGIFLLEDLFYGGGYFGDWTISCRPGDILYVDMRPWYRPTFCMIGCIYANILELSTCLFPSFDGTIAEGTFKYGEFLPKLLTDNIGLARPFYSPWYRAELYTGELPEEFAFMKPISDRLKEEPGLSKRLYHLFDDNKCRKSISYRPVIIEKSAYSGISNKALHGVWRPDRKEAEWWEKCYPVRGMSPEQLSEVAGIQDAKGSVS